MRNNRLKLCDDVGDSGRGLIVEVGPLAVKDGVIGIDETADVWENDAENQAIVDGHANTFVQRDTVRWNKCGNNSGNIVVRGDGVG